MTPPRGRRRRRGSGPIRCDDCHRPVDMLSDPHAPHRTRPFEQRQVDGRTHIGVAAYPVEGRRAWLLRDLVEDLMIRRRCSRQEAEQEAYAMPWQPVHQCRHLPEGDPAP
ncbi:hypothetical protein [Nocardioides marmoraquaticus]